MLQFSYMKHSQITWRKDSSFSSSIEKSCCLSLPLYNTPWFCSSTGMTSATSEFHSTRLYERLYSTFYMKDSFLRPSLKYFKTLSQKDFEESLKHTFKGSGRSSKNVHSIEGFKKNLKNPRFEGFLKYT